MVYTVNHISLSPSLPPSLPLYQLQQELWAVDLDIGYSDHLALFNLMSYVTGARLHQESGQLVLPGGEGRYAILSPHLLHTNLSVIHYAVFFQMCKAHHIGYDPKVKSEAGTYSR